MFDTKQKPVSGALGGIRTHGLSLRRAALYPLSYKRLMVTIELRQSYHGESGGAEGEI